MNPEGAFSLFGDYITGRRVELVTNQRIVQAWRAGSWAPGIYSIARFELAEQDSATKLVFDHTGFPDRRLVRELLGAVGEIPGVIRGSGPTVDLNRRLRATLQPDHRRFREAAASRWQGENWAESRCALPEVGKT